LQECFPLKRFNSVVGISGGEQTTRLASIVQLDKDGRFGGTTEPND